MKCSIKCIGPKPLLPPTKPVHVPLPGEVKKWTPLDGVMTMNKESRARDRERRQKAARQAQINATDARVKERVRKEAIIMKMAPEGATLEEMATATGYSVGTVQKVCWKYKLVETKSTIRAKRVETIKKMALEGADIPTMAKATGWTPATVRDTMSDLRKQGVPLPYHRAGRKETK